MTKDRKIELLEKWEVTGDEQYLDEALKLYGVAIEEDPTNPELLFYYGWLNQSKGMAYLRKAADYLTRGLETNPDRNSWIYGKLNSQFIVVRDTLGQNHQSVEFYKQRVSEFPDDAKLYCFLAECYLRADQVQEAKKVVESGLKVNVNHAHLNCVAGSVAAREGNSEQALRFWERATELDSEFIDPRFSRAPLLEQEQRLEECANEWRVIIAWLGERGWLADHAKVELQRVEQKLNA